MHSRLNSRLRTGSTAAVLLAGTAILVLPATSIAAPEGKGVVVAQAITQQPAEDKNKPAQPPARKPPPKPPETRPTPPPQRPAQPSQAQPTRPPAPAQEHVAPPKPPSPPAHERPRPPTPPQAKPNTPPQTNTAPQGQQQRPAFQERRDDRREERRDQRSPAAQTPTPQAPTPPRTPAPNTITPAQRPNVTPPAQPPAAQQQPNLQHAPATQTALPPAPSTPVQRRDASEFIRRGNAQTPAPNLNQIKQHRQEVREGNRTVIREDNRVIIRQDNRVFIEHNDADRFAVGARNVQTARRGNNTETIVERGNGVRIINETDSQGRLLRRYRRGPDGRDVVIIDNRRAFGAGLAAGLFLSLAEPVVRIPRNRYILDADVAQPADVYGVLMEPPVEVIDQPYSLDQVRYNAPLRDRMPRIDLDINFDTGSWQLTEDQIDRLSVIAEAINRALQRNPAEVFMIEGYTDATGNDVDNLSLSDRRAEAVAVALTEQFQVPAENLVTQGYGEQYLKIPTQGPERRNRRVSVRRITPLLDAQAGGPPPPR